MRESLIRFKGGVWINSVAATWPFGELELKENELIIRCRITFGMIPNEIHLPYDKITRIQYINRWILGCGIRFIHKEINLPDPIVFWLWPRLNDIRSIRRFLAARIPDKALKLEQVKIEQRELREILNDWSFIAHGLPDDEYDYLRDKIIPFLSKESDRDGLRDLISKEVHGHYGVNVSDEDIERWSSVIFFWWMGMTYQEIRQEKKAHTRKGKIVSRAEEFLFAFILQFIFQWIFIIVTALPRNSLTHLVTIIPFLVAALTMSYLTYKKKPFSALGVLVGLLSVYASIFGLIDLFSKK